MWDWQNSRTKAHDVRYSRYVASWIKNGDGYFDEKFKNWLRSINLTEDEVYAIYEMATCGKSELETSITEYLKAH